MRPILAKILDDMFCNGAHAELDRFSYIIITEFKNPVVCFLTIKYVIDVIYENQGQYAAPISAQYKALASLIPELIFVSYHIGLRPGIF